MSIAALLVVLKMSLKRTEWFYICKILIIEIITLANCLSLELGSLAVVIMIFGSSTPAHLYSSSTLVVRPRKKIFTSSKEKLLPVLTGQNSC